MNLNKFYFIVIFLGVYILSASSESNKRSCRPTGNTTVSEAGSFGIKKKESTKGDRRYVTYEMGYRQRGDFQNFHEEDYFTYPNPGDYFVEVDYDGWRKCRGHRVTYVAIDVQSDNAMGNAFISRGGIGRSYISVVIEVISTRVLGYDVKVFVR